MTPEEQSFWKWAGTGMGGGLLGFLAWILPKLYRTFLNDKRATDKQEFDQEEKHSATVFAQAERIVEQCITRMDRMDSRISELQMKQADCEARHAAEVHLRHRCEESRKILRVKMKLVELGIGPRNPNYLKEYERLLVDMEHHPDDARYPSPGYPSSAGSGPTHLPIRPAKNPQHYD